MFGGAASQPPPRYAKAGLPGELSRLLLDADTQCMVASLGQQPCMQVSSAAICRVGRTSNCLLSVLCSCVLMHAHACCRWRCWCPPTG